MNYRSVFASQEVYDLAVSFVKLLIINEEFENYDECLEAVDNMIYDEVDKIYKVKASYFVKAELRAKINNTDNERYFMRVRN